MDGFEKAMKEQLHKIMENIINDVSEKIFECLKQHIEQDMYQPRNEVYVPSRGNTATYEFLNAFDLNSLKNKINSASRNIVYNWEGMHTWRENYTYTNSSGKVVTREVPVHESVWGEDVREALFDILQNRNNRGCMPNRPVSYYKDFWEEFVKDANFNLKLWIENSLRKQNITDFYLEISNNEIT